MTLHRGGQGDIADTDALGAILALMRALADQPLELPLRIELGERALGLAVDQSSTQALDVRACLAKALGESGQLQPAITALEALLADRTRVLGPDHPDTLWTRHGIAQLQGDIGAHDQALASFESLIQDATDALGPDHADTRITRERLAQWRRQVQ